jgi:hypothetical protein
VVRDVFFAGSFVSSARKDFTQRTQSVKGVPARRGIFNTAYGGIFVLGKKCLKR